MKPAPCRVSLLAFPLSMLSGLLLALALPPHDLRFFGWFAYMCAVTLLALLWKYYSNSCSA